MKTLILSTAIRGAGMADISPEVSEWNDQFNSSILMFIIVTLLFAGLTFVTMYFSNLNEIAKNFGKYRCNPAFMPFAGQFGYDARENFNFCISSILNDQIAEAFAPLYKMLSQFTGILTVMMNAVMGIRKLFSNFFLSVNNFIGSVRNRIQNLLFQIRLSFMKMNNLMGRVFGTMYAVIFMGMSSLTAGSNIAESDLAKFMMEFCFDPETPITLESGKQCAIKDIKIGDRLAALPDAHVPVVTSTFVFDGAQTPVVKINDVVLSDQHYVQYEGAWIPAGNHPNAQRVPSLTQLICLNVSGNTFLVGDAGLVVRDYDEHVSASVVEQTQAIASKALNGYADTPTIADYSLGFDPALEVKLACGRLVRADAVKLGDELYGAGRVLGLVQEVCEECVSLKGHDVSAAQLIFDQDRWIRAGTKYETTGPRTLLQFVTEKCGVIVARSDAGHEYFLRDYREVPLPEMESPYEEEFEAESASSPGFRAGPKQTVHKVEA